MQTLTATANECSKLLETIGYKVESDGPKLNLNKDDKSYSVTILGKSDKPYLTIPVKAIDVQHLTVSSVETNMIGIAHNEHEGEICSKYLYVFKKEDLKNFAESVYEKLEEAGRFGFTDSTENDSKRIHVHYKDAGYIGCLHLDPSILIDRMGHMKKHLGTVQTKSVSIKNETPETGKDDFNW